ncbi:MAG: substrate-binding domain-containing protein [Verrucomicrobiota bacterium]|nr:substrate-binding domain-containing protein [Verrucomicrobiota bacterium]
MCSTNANEVRIAVSDLIAGTLTDTLMLHAEENNLQYKIDSIGSLPALDKLNAGEVDMALIAIPSSSIKLSNNYQLYPLAYSTSIVAVNVNNPLDEISINRLSGTFGSHEELSLSTWSEIGLSGWGNRGIKPIVGQLDGSISLELFKHIAFEGSKLRSTVNLLKNNAALSIISNDVAAIAILPMNPEDKYIKVLSVAKDQDSPAFEPSDDNIHFGDYPFRLSFYIVLLKSEVPNLAYIVEALLSDSVAEVLSASHFVPIPYNVRQQLQMDLTLSSNRAIK